MDPDVLRHNFPLLIPILALMIPIVAIVAHYVSKSNRERQCHETIRELVKAGQPIADRARARLREGSDTFLWTLVGNYPERVSAELVFQAAEQHDKLAWEIVLETAHYLGIALATLVNLFNPERIILGGPVGQAGRVMLEPLLEEVRRRAIAYPLSVVKIEISSLGHDASAIGAAVLVLQQASEFIFAEK